MSIHVHCACGHQFKVKDKYAGRQGSCPACHVTVQVPGIAAASTELASTSSFPAAEAEHSAADERLRLARIVQQRLLPRKLPEVSAFDLAGISHTGALVGGDCFDYIPLQDGTLGIIVADASGHGLGAALLMTEIRICLRALGQANSDPGTIFTLANRVFLGGLPDDYYATAILARLDLNTRQFTYASAGHPTGYVIDAAGKMKWQLESTDCPLGLLAQTQYGTSSPIQLSRGESVLLLTGGIPKAAAADGSHFGVQRALDALAQHQDQPAAVGLEALYQAVCRFTGQQQHQDDLTAVVVKVR